MFKDFCSVLPECLPERLQPFMLLSESCESYLLPLILAHLWYFFFLHYILTQKNKKFHLHIQLKPLSVLLDTLYALYTINPFAV